MIKITIKTSIQTKTLIQKKNHFAQQASHCYKQNTVFYLYDLRILQLILQQR